MAKQVQELIDKIKQEGFLAAKEKAQTIEASAQEKAKVIVEQAQKQEKDILDTAHREAERLEETAKAAIKQAARDMVLDLRREIQKILNTIIKKDVKESLSPEALAGIITEVAKNFCEKTDASADIKVVLGKSDLESLKKGAIAKIQEEIKQKITFESSEEIAAGFTISFDSGKSSFDFTDESLSEYLSAYLNPEIGALVKDSQK
ncbi:MAG: V-type ATP synthase subunit E family protein [Candidatus Aceula meridiana]|nr:V-type ATP synthase subunit E family protein [Candidatus Aceula meridiana]